MHSYETPSINGLYPQLVGDVLSKGTVERQHNDTTDKTLVTRELHPAIIELHNPLRRLITSVGRPVNVPFALAEVLWILGGRNDVEMLQHYNSRIHTYSDDGVTFNAAYGNRIRRAFGHDQLIDVARTLIADHGSRQAVIALWHPEYDRGWAGEVPHVAKDRACNVISHFMIRNGALDLTQILRSNDLLWGVPYNLMQWTHIQEYIATMVGVEMGRYIHIADSLHIYDWHWEEAKRIAKEPAFDLYSELEWEHAPLWAGATQEVWLHKATALEEQLRNSGFFRQADMDELPLAWQRIIRVLLAHDAFKRGHDHNAFTHLTAGDPDQVYMAATLRFWWNIRWHKSEYRNPMQRLIQSLGENNHRVNDWIMEDPTPEP